MTFIRDAYPSFLTDGEFPALVETVSRREESELFAGVRQPFMIRSQ